MARFCPPKVSGNRYNPTAQMITSTTAPLTITHQVQKRTMPTTQGVLLAPLATVSLEGPRGIENGVDAIPRS